MPRTEKYFIGPGLLGDIRRTIARVDGAPYRVNGNLQKVAHQEMPRGDGGKVFRVCTFTGAWSINASKTVTFKNQTATPNTASVTNLFWPVPDGPERDCAIAKDGTAWYLIVPRLYSANAATAAEITTAAIDFKTLPVAALATAGTATFSLSITTCSTAT